MKLPHRFLGQPVEGSIGRVLGNETGPQLASDARIRTSPNSMYKSEEYILLPGTTHGSYSYGDTLVSMHRSHLNETWLGAHHALARENACMLTLRQFVDFLKLLQSGNVLDERGNRVPQITLNLILDSIWKVEGPWRGEWLDTKFETTGSIMGLGGKTRILYEHRVVNGKLQHQQAKEITPHRRTERYHISRDAWLSTSDESGLPSSHRLSGDIDYYPPTNQGVVWFSANSKAVGLSCQGQADETYSHRGVRITRKKM